MTYTIEEIKAWSLEGQATQCNVMLEVIKEYENMLRRNEMMKSLAEGLMDGADELRAERDSLASRITPLREFAYEVSLPAYKDSDYKSLFETLNATAKAILADNREAI